MSVLASVLITYRLLTKYHDFTVRHEVFQLCWLQQLIPFFRHSRKFSCLGCDSAFTRDLASNCLIRQTGVGVREAIAYLVEGTGYPHCYRWCAGGACPRCQGNFGGVEEERRGDCEKAVGDEGHGGQQILRLYWRGTAATSSSNDLANLIRVSFPGRQNLSASKRLS